MSVPEVLLSVGIEMEFLTPLQDLMANLKTLRGLGVHVTHDASAETPVRVLQENRLVIESDSITPGLTMGEKAGGEVVTDIWFNGDPDNILKKIRQITSIFQGQGESSNSKRGGIHFHVAYTHNTKILKNIILLGTHLEKLFYTIGGFGYENRGKYNDAIYFRPITRKGPLVVPLGESGWVQCFTKERLMEAKSSEDYFERYGDTWNTGHPAGNRYFPTRYHWLNLANLPATKKTLEFRVFNTTLNPLYIWSSLQFSVAFARLALISTPDELIKMGFDEEHSVFDKESKDVTIRTLEYFAEQSKMSRKVLDIILAIVDETPEPIFKEYYTKSHLHAHPQVSVRSHFKGSRLKLEKIHGNSIKDPTYEDYHTLSRTRSGRSRQRAVPSSISAYERTRARLQAENDRIRRTGLSTSDYYIQPSEIVYGEESEESEE